MGVIPPYGRGEQERHAFRSAAAGPPADPTNPGCDAVLGTAPRLSISVYNQTIHSVEATLRWPLREKNPKKRGRRSLNPRRPDRVGRLRLEELASGVRPA